MIEIIFPSVSSILCITAIGIVFGLILSVANIKLHVETDPRYEKILDILPGANCGSCGYPGCSGYAMNIVECGASPNLCPLCGEDKVCAICDIMGTSAEAGKPKVAVVKCQGDYASSKRSFIYDGPKSCEAAQMINEGFKVCPYGCLGLGDCERACPFNAIHISGSGLPVVDRERCTGCGNCVEACPRDIIKLIDRDFKVYVLCKNEEKGAVMKKGCAVGCIGCKRCVKTCQEVFKDNPDIESAIEVNNFLATIDYGKCIDCGKCAEVCPNKVIAYQKETVNV